ncbi:MAG: elongation factor P [Planctomycetales bacterium]|nr:elongation factor P [Planctomycetales bacterium]
MLAKEVKTGTIVSYQGAPCLIQTMQVQTPSARGAATLYKFRARNLVTKQKVDITLKGTDTLDDADFEKRLVKLMYSDGTDVHFLDQADFNQHAIPVEQLSDELNYLTEELEDIYVLIYEGEPVGLQLPSSVELDVTQCDPAVRGNSATSRSKSATLSTGYVLQVPEYLKEGERIKVDTRTGEFLSRA